MAPRRDGSEPTTPSSDHQAGPGGSEAWDAVDRAFAAAPRKWFLPAGARERAGFDGPIQIGHGQTSSQPRTVREMLLLLEVRPGHRVLDVGSGSGWTTALLAELVGPSGSVRGVELEPDLVAWGSENLARGQWPWASITAAEPGVIGDPSHAPYDRVLVSAEARKIPQTCSSRWPRPRGWCCLCAAP